MPVVEELQDEDEQVVKQQEETKWSRVWKEDLVGSIGPENAGWIVAGDLRSYLGSYDAI